MYLTGWAGSADFPVTSSAFQSTLRQGCTQPLQNQYYNGFTNFSSSGDAWVAKIAGDGATLMYSTFLGGTCADQGLSIAVDSAGSVLVAGVTNSPDFPTTQGSYLPVSAGAENTGFLAKLTPEGDGSAYSTYIGGYHADVVEAVTVDAQGNAYVAGTTYGLNEWSVEPGACVAYYSTYGSDFDLAGIGGGFLLKLDPSGQSKIFSSYFGSCYTTATSIALDTAGRIWVAGTSCCFVNNLYAADGGGPAAFTSTIRTLHPFQGGGLGTGFVSEYAPDGSTLLFSSLADSVAGLALDPAGNAYLSGHTFAADIPKVNWNGLAVSSAAALRIDGAVGSPITIEEPKSMASVLVQGEPYPTITAAGAMLTIIGTGLGPDQELTAKPSADGLYPTALGGMTTYFDGIAAPLISVQAQKIVCMAPFELDGHSTVTLQAVTANGTKSNAIRLPVSPAGVAILEVLNQDGTTNSVNNPAASSSVITAYVSGMGQTNPPSVNGKVSTGEIPQEFIDSGIVTVLFDGQWKADILYAGTAPGQIAGVTAIKFQIPASVPTGQWNLAIGYEDDPTKSEYRVDFDETTVYIGAM